MSASVGELLRQLIERTDHIGHQDHENLGRVVARGDMVLRRGFGEDNAYRPQLAKIKFRPTVYPTTEDILRNRWRSGVAELRTLFETALEEWELFGVQPPIVSDLQPQGSQAANRDPTADGRTVFIVHGHDDLAKTSVARFTEKLSLNAVILHERASQGRTVIEKFEQESSVVDFAIVLLTGDDEVTVPGEIPQKRARQNVVFELGYFIGLLGRSRVAALVQPGVEIPSDYSGVVYIRLEGDNWKLELAKEMKQGGLPVDLNDAL